VAMNTLVCPQTWREQLLRRGRDYVDILLQDILTVDNIVSVG